MLWRWKRKIPEIALVRPKEDECDGCYAINTELTNPDLTAERRAELEELKKNALCKGKESQ